MVKWTFNLCKELATPSLKTLHLRKCHGPVGLVMNIIYWILPLIDLRNHCILSS